METPCSKLAANIIERLIREHLLTDQYGKRLLPKLEEGKLQPGDWRLALELSDPEEGRQ